MNRKVKLIALAGLATLLAASTAFADKLCLQTTVNKKTFKVTNKSVRAATCPRGYTELADTSSFQGPAGAQGSQGATGAQGPAGVQGAAGLVNISACRTVSQVCSHGFGPNTCTANCANGEFVLQENTTIGYGSCNTVGTIAGASTSPSLTYSNGVAGGITFYTYTTESCSYSATVYVVCCPW